MEESLEEPQHPTSFATLLLHGLQCAQPRREELPFQQLLVAVIKREEGVLVCGEASF